MQFKHPELLYALFLLIIPIIIHLFQLRRFQKVEFTNVQFLKNVIMQTRKSSQLKKWLILLTRLLLIAATVFAFAQPYFSKINIKNTRVETVIYLDNSFSMQAKGDKGELLKRAVQDLITEIDNKQKITLFTNNTTYKNTTITAIKNDLLALEYTPNQIDYEAVILKGKQLFNNASTSIKNFIALSDFQDRNTSFNLKNDSLYNIHLVKLQPVNTNNISIDSVYISKTNPSNIELSVLLNASNNQDISNVPISLFEEENLIAKTSISVTNNTAIFSLPIREKINAKVTIEDTSLQFDNKFYFNINTQEKINVLTIYNTTPNDFLERIYTKDEFNYNAVSSDNLNYNTIAQQNLIILNELDNLSVPLINTLKTFTSNGGSLLVIPSSKLSVSNYNELLGKSMFEEIIDIEKKITTINYVHPVFNNVFEKEITNFQYPKVKQYFKINFNNSPLLSFEDDQAFLIQNNNTFVFTAALNTTNSNFTNSPLVVPTLYNISRQSLQLPKLYYTIGKEHRFDVNVSLQQDDILNLVTHKNLTIIPQQQTFNNKVAITTNDVPDVAGIYAVNNKTETIKHVSYNYNKGESKLNYIDFKAYKGIRISNSLPKVINDLKSDLTINALWKWFVIFALVLLIIEMLILKYFK